MAFHAIERPERIAISKRLVGGHYEVTTWRDLFSLVRSFSARLAPLDGEFVPILSAKSPDAIAASIAALAVGKSFAYLNTKLRAPQLNDALRATKASFALVDADNARLLIQAPSDAIKEIEWLTIGEREAAMKSADQLTLAGLRARVFVDLPDSAFEIQPPSSRPGCCLFTSGSTGKPKGVLISSVDLVRRAEAELKWFDLSADDVLLSLLPLSFDVGLAQLLGSVWAGCELSIATSWFPADIVSTIEVRHVTGVCGVPAIWQDMLSVRNGRAFDFPNLRFITVSGGSLPHAQFLALKDMLPNTGVFKTYGQTEDFRSTSLRPEDAIKHVDSVGRAYVGVTLRIVDENDLCLPAGGIGEVVHSGMGTMLGYLGTEDPRKLRTIGGETEASIFTGDYGFLDDAGFLYLKGRRDSMAKVAGNRVFPAEIVNGICAISGIAEAQVIMTPGSDGDATITAFVVLAATATFDQKILRRKLRDVLPSYMLPHQLTILADIPRTNTGKPDLTQLAAWAKNGASSTHT